MMLIDVNGVDNGDVNGVDNGDINGVDNGDVNGVDSLVLANCCDEQTVRVE